MHVTGTTQNATFPYYHSMTGVETLHSKYNLEGQGIKVGVIDSGIDYMHPALGGCFGTNCRVAYGWDFVGDDYNDKNKPVEDADPRDCMGHGTHVAGIIGARDKSFVGVAPSVTFGAYRVFGCDSRADDDIIVRAMELAYIQNMDVINLSLGGDGNWPQSFDTVVAEWLTRKGLIVVAAMGNSATNGIWEASSPGVAPSVFSVAALDNVKYQAYTFTINGDASRKIPYQSSKADQRLNFNTTEVVAVGTGAASIGCDSIKLNLTGKIALIKRGSCSFPQKALNAQKAGASAVIIYNNVFGILAPGGEDPEIKIPFVGIEQSTGEDFAKRLSKGPLKLDFGTNIVEFSNPTGGHIADFSSWGPGPRSEIKPDIGAPGGLIYSTYPLAKGSYATESGTSMATPYVVGSVALYLQVKGLNITQHPFDGSTSQKIKFNTTAQTIDQQRMREAFQNSARPTTEVRADQLTSSVALQGAGLIDVERAIFNTLHVKPSRLALNDTQYLGNRKGNAQVRTIQITNTGSEKRTYTVTHRPAVSVRGLDDNGVPPVKPELLSFSASSIVVQPKQTVDVDVHITQPASLPESQLWIFSGYVVVSPNTNSSKSLSNEAVHVPYLGIKGRLSNIHVLQATKDLPSFTNVATSKKITQQDQTTPTL
ncbi:peptidase S8/S53 domain-containing protein [Syncephalis fuscata]|nr:peptidase S8/S53 domain-containing protein [Syncephalis fuscata]